MKCLTLGRVGKPVQKVTSYTRLQYMNTIANDESFSLGDSEEELEFSATLANSRHTLLQLLEIRKEKF